MNFGHVAQTVHEPSGRFRFGLVKPAAGPRPAAERASLKCGLSRHRICKPGNSSPVGRIRNLDATFGLRADFWKADGIPRISPMPELSRPVLGRGATLLRINGRKPDNIIRQDEGRGLWRRLQW